MLMLAQCGARVAAPALAVMTRQEGKGGMMRGRGKRAKANSSHFQCLFRGARAAGCTPATSTLHCTGEHGVLCGTHGCVGTACAQLAGLLLLSFFCCCCLFLSKGAPQAQERSLVSHLEEDTAELSAGCLLGSGRFGLAGPSSPVPAAGKRRQGNISPAVIRALRGHLGRWRHSQISGRCATEPPLQQCLGRRSRRQHLSGPGRARC